jgi:malonate decarboxylase alpha subunit
MTCDRSVSRAEHLDLFERGIARKLDFSSPARRACASTVGRRPARSRHVRTYIDSTRARICWTVPNVALAGFQADRHGSIYTGPTPKPGPGHRIQ